MTNPFLRSNRLASLPVLFALGLVPPGCGDKKEDSAKGADPSKSDGATADPKKEASAKAGEAGAEAQAEGDGVAATVLDAVANPPKTADGLPDRGVALGWVIAPTIEGFLSEVKTQALPAQYAMYGDIATIKGMAGLLGEKAIIVQHFNFAAPVGCVLIDDPATETPVACFFGYEGGSAAVSTDVGEGKQADPAGHVAFHKLEGKDLYLDDLDGTVVATTHADLFGKAKALLTETVLPRAKTQKPDIEVMAYPSAGLGRYGSELSEFAAIAGPSATASMDSYKEIEAARFGFSLEPSGAHMGMTVKAVAGSNYAEAIKAMGAGVVDTKWLTLPASTWAVMASNMSAAKLFNNESVRPGFDAMIDGYVKETGADKTAVSAAIDTFVTETSALYGTNVSLGMMHEPGTTGAVVLVAEKIADGREKWKAWSESFKADAVLDKKALKKVEWAFKADAAVVDGVAADRWTIKAKKITDKDVEKVAKRFGGKLELTIDRFELADRVIFVAALSDIEANDKAAVAAAKGTQTIADAAGGADLLAATTGAVSVGGMDLKRMFAWLTEVVPESAPYPAVGVDFSDVRFVTTVGVDRYDVDIVLNQPVIDQIKGQIP